MRKLDFIPNIALMQLCPLKKGEGSLNKHAPL
jgi:hypothetical protein